MISGKTERLEPSPNWTGRQGLQEAVKAKVHAVTSMGMRWPLVAAPKKLIKKMV